MEDLVPVLVMSVPVLVLELASLESGSELESNFEEPDFHLPPSTQAV